MSNYCICQQPHTDWRWDSSDRLYLICNCCGKSKKPCDHVFGKIAVRLEGEMHIYNMRLSNEQYIKIAKDPYFSNFISLLAHCSECGEKLNIK